MFFNQRGLRAGWRLVIFAALLFAIGYAAIAALTLLSSLLRSRSGPGAAPSPLWLSLVEITQFLVVVLVSWIMANIERRKSEVYGLPVTTSALPRFGVGFLLWGFLPLSLVLLIMRSLRVFYFGDLAVHGSAVLYWALAWGLMFLAVGLLEEYSFRGYALYTLADGIGFWPAAIVLAVGFAYIHMSNGGENRIGIAGVFLYAIFAAATLWRTGNLWLAVGAHAGWDWGQSFFYGVSDSGLQVEGHLLNPRIQGPDWLSGGSVGPEGSIVTLIFWGLMTVCFLAFYPEQRKAAPPLLVASGEQRR
ncbi:MAG TPA: type II CAAX endopeptidase family protein [Candidatus Angelobacter sp.]|nr:type II CAAX endopeptidase family protein [Candidatus Angelobacter sp.]